MFNRQADSLETRIRDHYYDLVLFEYLPTLNNFYPFRVRDSLRASLPAGGFHDGSEARAGDEGYDRSICQ